MSWMEMDLLKELMVEPPKANSARCQDLQHNTTLNSENALILVFFDKRKIITYEEQNTIKASVWLFNSRKVTSQTETLKISLRKK